LEQAWSGTGSGRPAELCAWLTLIGVRAARAARSGRERDLIARFEALLEREFARRHAVGWYARALGVSPTHLSRLCRARHGASARALIARRVMREARRLLLYTERSVAEVAEAVGFADPNHFSRAFARATGQPPTAFRRTARRALVPDGGAP
ncbi:MAG: AraC family transcriptional regulator, partial [Alphaproteobacteria bacterium]